MDNVVIAQTYELIQHIGSGGGGDVYLAKHLRLDKLVVLKADKRKLNTRPELLRREVDVLKDLTHSYIPKVYDFFTENDTVYTVMDYIAGESLDRPLKRGERFSQAQVIEWAVELLQALEYLHSPIHGDPPRGFVHSDIKPANIMRTPYNTICLIDFNISLALGEVNFVGCSAGYASPEHYGLDYTDVGSNTTDRPFSRTNSTNTPSTPSNPSTPSSSQKKMVLPDVRSDIYSTGATLYHLLSGKRPARDATEVAPLSDKEFSPQLVHIISKAMSLDPNRRYQTAAEMRYDLEHLHENDPRGRKLKRRFITVEACLAALLLAGAFSTFTGLKRTQAAETAARLAADSRDALSAGNADKALDLALSALEEKPGLFTPEHPAEAERALAAALGTYDLSDSYRSAVTADLGSEPLSLELSPDSSTFACMLAGKAVVCRTDTAEQVAELPADISALSQIHYLDSDTVVYAGEHGITAYSISGAKELWSGQPATGISVSRDGSVVAGVYRDESHATLYRAADGSVLSTVDFGGRKQRVVLNDIFIDPHDDIFCLDEHGSLLAATFSDGSLSVFSTDGSGDEITIVDSSDFSHFEGGFYRQYLAFSASSADSTQVASVDCESLELMWQLDTDGRYSVRTDADGIYLQTDSKLVRIDPVTAEQTPLVTAGPTMSAFSSDGQNTVISMRNARNGLSFFNSEARPTAASDDGNDADMLAMSDSVTVAASQNSGTVRLLAYRDNSDSLALSYDADYSHDEARMSADGKTFMLFSTEGFRIYGADGSLAAEAAIPEPDKIYDQQFRRENGNSWLEVIYYSGRTLKYSAADGSLISDENGAAPDPSLHEEFTTDKFRISSDLHGGAKVYDIKTGKLVCEPDISGYLTYVDQLADGRTVLHYITTSGLKYGAVVNDNCEILADLPFLCDVIGGRAVFDLPDGTLRTSPVYSLDELIASAKQ